MSLYIRTHRLYNTKVDGTVTYHKCVSGDTLPLMPDVDGGGTGGVFYTLVNFTVKLKLL